MTLRLILVGLVAALGLTLPQWSNHKGRSGLTQTGAIRSVNNVNKQNNRIIPRTGRGVVADRRTSFSSNSASFRRFQPAALATQGTRPNRKIASNFWQVPSGPRSVPKASPITSRPSAVIPVGQSFEPIRIARVFYEGVSNGLGQCSGVLSGEFHRLSASLEAMKSVRLPIVPSDDLYPGLALSLNRASEGLGRLGPIPNRSPLAGFRPLRAIEPGSDVYDTIAATFQFRPTTKVPGLPNGSGSKGAAPGGQSSSFTTLASVLDRAEGLALNLNDRAVQIGPMIRDSTRPFRLALRSKDDSRLAVVESKTVKAELANFPDDVFSDGARQTAELADLPDGVFSVESRRVVVAQTPAPAPSVDFPADVFAADAPSPVDVTAVVALKDVPARGQLGGTNTSGGLAEKDRISIPATRPSETDLGPDHFTKAVSLTRDAAVAWMKLLSGPAVVTLNR